MQKLRDHLELLSTLAGEAEKLNRLEKLSRDTVDNAVAHGKADSDSDLAKLSLATTRLQLIPSQRNKLKIANKNAVEDLQPILRRSTSKWSRFVQSMVDEKEAEFFKLVAPWYDGSIRTAKREITAEHIPVLIEMRRCYFAGHVPDNAPLEDHLSNAATFLAHAARSCKKYGWEMPE